MSHCMLCPRECGANRNTGAGFCGAGNEPAYELECENYESALRKTLKTITSDNNSLRARVAKIMLHTYEEPPISGTNGSGAVFFAGCNLGCIFCQNKKISRGSEIEYSAYTSQELADEYLKLERSGAHNINLVTAGHYLSVVIDSLKIAKRHLKIPVVYNTSSYEKAEAIKSLGGLADVFLPDYKFFDSALSERYCMAADYPRVARAAITEMLKLAPKAVFDDNGIMQSGVIIRHLVIPSCRADSLKIIEDIAKNFGGARLSLMSQYTPQFSSNVYPELNRKTTSFEYNTVLSLAERLGLQGYMQGRESAKSSFTPEF